MTTSVTRLYFTTQHKTSKTKTDFLVSDRSCSKTNGLRPHHWFGGALWAPQLGSGRSPDRPKIFSLFSALRMASPDTIILYYCGSKKEKFLTHSILSQLLCDDAVWCFFSIWDEIHNRKVASDGLHCREEERSMRGDSTLGGIPLSSAGLRPHGPWRTVEISGPDLTWNLSFIFITASHNSFIFITFENTKVAKIGKGSVFFFKLNWHQKNFWHRNRWERNPKLQVFRINT